MIKEGKVNLSIKTKKIVSKSMDVFYNPVMELNRTISVILLNSIENSKMQIGLPLAGSGVRGIRFLKELNKNKIKNISFNDYDSKAIKTIEQNLKLNKVRITKKIALFNEDANLFLLKSKGFDYIDIDPFGSPNFLLDSSVRRLARNGILAVTATDTSALSGTYTNACQRKYWAKPLKSEIMHEVGLRILIRKVQLVGCQYDKALIPIFSHSSDHYMRVFFGCEKGKSKVDKMLKKHDYYNCAGPMWLGELWETKLVNKMKKSGHPLIETISKECKINSIGFYHLPSFVKKYKLGEVPKQDKVIMLLKKKKFKVAITHFKENSLRTNANEKEMLKIIKQAR